MNRHEDAAACNCGGNHSAIVGFDGPGNGHAVTCPVRTAATVRCSECGCPVGYIHSTSCSKYPEVHKRSAACASRRLAIADPPYPPRLCTKGYLRPRASRWYGDTFVATSDRPADVHPEAVEWDDPAKHRALLERLMDEYDGWAIATSPDGLEAYAPIPAGARIMAWFKKVAQPGGHRIHSLWEPVIVLPPVGRRDNRGVGCVPDVLTAAAPRVGFIGAKPPEWVTWVLDALGYQEGDTVDDLFPGSGAVSAAIAQTRLAV